MALNAAMTVAARSLEVFQTGIEVAGQNVANANTPGYVREELRLESGYDYNVGRVIKGTGSHVTGIRLAVDTYLEHRLHAANTDLATSETRSNAYLMLEGVLNELGDADISTRLNDLLGSLNDFASEPTLGGLRELVLTNGREFADALKLVSSQVTELRNAYDTRIEATTTEANELVDRIHELNAGIVRLELGGTIHSDSGSLRSERLAALDRLSQIVEISVDERPSGAVDVRVGEDYLVLGTGTRHFETIPSSALYDVDQRPEHIDGYRFVQLSENGSQNLPEGGELPAMIAARDDVLGGFLDQLNDYAATFVFEFNKVYSAGSGTAGFTDVTGEHGVLDSAAVLSDAAATGLDFTPQHGAFDLVVSNASTGIAQTTTIVVDLDGIGGNDVTLDDLALAIDAVAGVNAGVAADGRLSITSDAGFEFRFDGDTSGVLAALGVNTFFSGTGAADVAVNSVLTDDPQLLAAGRGGGAGDARNVLDLIRLIEQPVAATGQSLDQMYETLVFGVAQNSRAEQNDAAGFRDFHDGLRSQREQYSGVSIDEETVRLMQYQHSYTAAARVLSTVDELMQILVNL